ncbi:MAG: LD-carboxypeptidase [Bacteroidales bacterium]|nr:LD-carboxypeptidase [Bacteroidales bacterium]
MRPQYLNKGDLAGITAPARWINPEDMENFMSILEAEGFRSVTGPIHTRHHQFAGDDPSRLDDLQSMLDNPDIRAIFCARGGYGSARLLKDIDLSEFAKNPKWLIGFSDITALHSLLQARLGCESLHACMPYSLRDIADRGNPGITSMFDALRGNMPEYRVDAHSLNRCGQAEGTLLGGNLSVLYSLTGTPYQLDTKNSILFREDVDEYLYHIDRMMQNPKLSGMLSDLKGLVIGGMTDMRDNEVPFGSNAFQIIRDTVSGFDYPVLFDFPAGRRNPNLALVLGRKYKLIVDAMAGNLLYKDS